MTGLFPFLIACFVVVPPVATVEPWADARLSVRDGMDLWLDAAHAQGEKPVTDGKLNRWADASGKRRHLIQPDAPAQPMLIRAGDVSIVRFDGIQTHLRAVEQADSLASFHLFVVLAPRQNLGSFQGILAFNAHAQRDYESGLNLDFGPVGSPRFSSLNLEGRGFGGAVNLRKGEGPFGKLHVVEIASDRQARSIQLLIDGKPEGSRPRSNQTIQIDEITLGARCYSNDQGPQHAQGFGRFDLAEMIVYDRALTPDQTREVRRYLDTKYAGLKQSLPPDSGADAEILEPVASPPPVQVFLPGFKAQQIPVDLTNINNVKYRADGKLVALGYDGRVWILSDTNNDGLEDTAKLFWGNKSGLRSTIGMDLTPPGYAAGDGLIVAGKTRCSLIVDTDKDDVADKEIEVAGGWKVNSTSVDALGVAFDHRDGSIYYGRGSFNYTDPLLRDKDGVAHASLTDGTSAILRVAPDFKSREIVATGIRFPVGLRFNRLGDLFATDQEGATWVPNGNPFDELLHIQKGRHYGFPARHPKHLPDVIDEPSTFDYSPQHQSTCGLNFNDPVKSGGPTFGPKRWQGDAIVTGYSRGKLYRTTLVKTAPGYVAQTQLFASLNMLTVDACVAPDGSLVVACHSGGPDWGSGPTGKGKLYKITYAERELPQPLFAWSSGSRELRVEFDRPVDPELLKGTVGQTRITGGVYVGAGDRFEVLWPGYAVVQMQKVSPRFNVPVRSAQLTTDRRTLVLATDPYPAAVPYAITLPGMGRPALDKMPAGSLPQYPQVDLGLDLTGCEAVWTNASGEIAWQGWLPHLDLQVARALTSGSASHDALWTAMKAPGQLTLHARLDLLDMLRPAVQPGSRLDYEYPAESTTVTFTSKSKIVVESAPVATATGSGSMNRLSLDFGKSHKSPSIKIVLKSEGEVPDLSVHWTTNEDSRPRPLPLRRTFVPWSKPRGSEESTSALVALPEELKGGSWARGRKVFLSAEAGCVRCHAMQGQGGEIGPDLSNLIHRDYVSVLRDINTPSFAINPDHLTYVLQLKDGRSLTGVIRSVGDRLRVGDVKGEVTEIARTDVEAMRPATVSTMPEGLPKALGSDRMRDLMTYLLAPPPSMPRDGQGPRPKPRALKEVHAALSGAPNPPEKTRPIRILLIAGPKDHGPGEHDYPAWQKAWSELLAAGDSVTVATAWEFPTPDELRKADVAVFFQHGTWDETRAREIDAFLARGGGIVYIHWAVDGGKHADDFSKRIGLSGQGAVSFRHGPLDLRMVASTDHPVVRNIPRLAMVDESYWKMVGELPSGRVLGTSLEEGVAQPQLWSIESGKGRVFVSIPGHYSWSFDDPLFRLILLRAIAWTAHEPVDRFNELVWPGAEVAR